MTIHTAALIYTWFSLVVHVLSVLLSDKGVEQRVGAAIGVVGTVCILFALGAFQ